MFSLPQDWQRGYQSTSLLSAQRRTFGITATANQASQSTQLTLLERILQHVLPDIAPSCWPLCLGLVSHCSSLPQHQREGKRWMKRYLVSVGFAIFLSEVRTYFREGNHGLQKKFLQPQIATLRHVSAIYSSHLKGDMKQLIQESNMSLHGPSHRF